MALRLLDPRPATPSFLSRRAAATVSKRSPAPALARRTGAPYTRLRTGRPLSPRKGRALRAALAELAEALHRVFSRAPDGAARAGAGHVDRPSEAEPDSQAHAPAASGSAVPRARRPRAARALLRAARGEITYPRARIRAAIRRARNRMRRNPAVTAGAAGVLAGATYILFSLRAGAGLGFAAWAAFVATGLALAAGTPLAVVYAWPVAVASAVGCGVWAVVSLGAGGAWLWLGVCAGLLAAYFAAGAAVPLVAAAAIGYVAWGVSGSLGAGAVPAAGVAAASFGALIAMRRTLTAPILAAAWTAASGAVASVAAWRALGESAPPAWALGTLPGPAGLAVVVLLAAACAAALVWPRARRGEKRTPHRGP